MRWSPATWAEITLQLDLGYQALMISVERADESDQASTSSPLGAKLGSTVGFTLRPWDRDSGLGLVFRGGFYGHLARVQGSTRVFALPEGSVGISYSF